jgi:hypothetical protein
VIGGAESAVTLAGRLASDATQFINLMPAFRPAVVQV